MTERFARSALIDHVQGETGLLAPMVGAEVKHRKAECFVAGDWLFNAEDLVPGLTGLYFYNPRIMGQNIQTQKAAQASAAKQVPAPVYTVVDRGQGRKSFWQRVGSCFVNRDGSLKVLLHALPVNGELIIREGENA